MSKELEALNDIRKVLEESYHFPLNLTNEYKIIKEALKRNEPMKVVFTRLTNALTEDFWDEPTCPKCKSLVIDEDKFCRECGQALDRSKPYEQH